MGTRKPGKPEAFWLLSCDGLKYEITGVGRTPEEAYRAFAKAYTRRKDRSYRTATARLGGGSWFDKVTPGQALDENGRPNEDWTREECAWVEAFQERAYRAMEREDSR